jgi:hypothetical protein
MSFDSTAVIRLLGLALAVTVGIIALRRKQVYLACTLIGAAVGAYAVLFLFEFLAIASPYHAYVSFAVIGQREFHPLYEYPRREQAVAVADQLNAVLGAVGLAAGAVVGLGVGWSGARSRGQVPASAAA